MLKLFHLYDKYRYGEVSARFKLYKHLRKLLPPKTCIGWDTYDMSLELYGMAPEFELEEKVRRKLHRLGFATIFISFTDNMETGYNWLNPPGHKPRNHSKSPDRCNPKAGYGYVL